MSRFSPKLPWGVRRLFRLPGNRARLCEENGDVRRFINVYVDGEDIRFLDQLQTNVGPQAEVSIVPAIAGG